jgi:hypothetical protein
MKNTRLDRTERIEMAEKPTVAGHVSENHDRPVEYDILAFWRRGLLVDYLKWTGQIREVRTSRLDTVLPGRPAGV